MAILAQGPVTAPAAGAPTPLDAASSAAAHACVYDRTQPVTGGAPELATQEIDGTLVTGRMITPAEVRQVNTALAQSISLGDCDLGAYHRFAVLRTDTSWTQVALDGCGVSQDGDAWRAPAALRSLVSSFVPH